MSELQSKATHSSPSHWRLVRAVFAANEELSAEESASTLFRFFRSSHVIDLRLIAGLALIALTIYFIILVLVGGPDEAFAIWHQQTGKTNYILPAYVIYASAGFVLYAVGLAWPLRTAERRCAVGDLRSIVWFTISALVTFVVIAITISEITFNNNFSKYFGPAIPVCGAVIAWAYLSATTRLGVVDLFACEIGTLCRVGTVFDIGTSYVNLHTCHFKLIKVAAAGKPSEWGIVEPDKPLVERTSSSDSREEYFPVFSSNSHDLEALEAMVVNNITEFYTYMKSARDLQRRLDNEPARLARPTLENLIYVLFLGYESGRKAIKDLIEFQPTRAENMIVVLLTELRCYSFLLNRFKEGDEDQLRRERLQLREEGYKYEVPRLALQVRCHAKERDLKDWIAAEKSIPELGRRYEAALGENLEQAIGRVAEEDKRRPQGGSSS